jgi:hypothetical protein
MYFFISHHKEMGGYRLDLSGSEGEPRIVLSEHGNYLMFHK